MQEYYGWNFTCPQRQKKCTAELVAVGMTSCMLYYNLSDTTKIQKLNAKKTPPLYLSGKQNKKI